MLVYLIILSVTTVSQTYAAVEVKQASHAKEGDETQKSKFPFLAYVNIGNNSCAGAILSDSWVLTARACGNTTEQESGWVHAGGRGEASSVQKRRIAQHLSCPDNHRLLLLQLEQPLSFDDAVSAVPVVRPGTFSDHDGPCDVITFGATPSETSLNTVHAVETVLSAGSECSGPASDSSILSESSSAAAASLDASHGTTAATVAVSTSQTQTSFITESAKISDNAGTKKERDTHKSEVKEPEIIDADLLCSSDISEEEASVKHLGSPVVCEGVLIALVTPKPSDGTSREKKEFSKTYYTAIGPDYSWITEKVPGVQVVSWNEVAKKSRSSLSKAVRSFTRETRLHKYKMHLTNARKRRLSRLADMIAEVPPGKDNSEDSKLELSDELEPHMKLNKIFSVLFPLSRRVRGIILLNRMSARPQSEQWGDVSEKMEAALRPVIRVKRSNTEKPTEATTTSATTSTPLMQPGSHRQAQRGGSASHKRQQELCIRSRRKRSTDGDAVSEPCGEDERASTRLAQRLAARDWPAGAPSWRERHR